jgi:hypothetical protein
MKSSICWNKMPRKAFKVHTSTDFAALYPERRVTLQMIKRFLFWLRHREALSAGLLNSLKKQEVSAKRGKGRKRSATVRTEEVVGAARKTVTRGPMRRVRHLARYMGLNQHCVNQESLVMACR